MNKRKKARYHVYFEEGPPPQSASELQLHNWFPEINFKQLFKNFPLKEIRLILSDNSKIIIKR